MSNMTPVKKQVPVYFTAEEHSRFKKMCKFEGRTMSTALRDLVAAKLKEFEEEGVK